MEAEGYAGVKEACAAWLCCVKLVLKLKHIILIQQLIDFASACVALYLSVPVQFARDYCELLERWRV